MQARHGRFHAAPEHRVSSGPAYPCRQRVSQERVTRDVDPVSGAEEQVIHGLDVTVGEGYRQLPVVAGPRPSTVRPSRIGTSVSRGGSQAAPAGRMAR